MNPLRPPDTFTQMVARFTVYGTPVTQGSATALVQPHPVKVGKGGLCRGGYARMVQNADMGRKHGGSGRLGDWRDAVKAAAENSRRGAIPLPGIDGPCEIVVTFYLERPRSLARGVKYPHKGLDVDKMARGVFDALKDAGMVTNDARFVNAHAFKRFAPAGTPPGAEIGVFVEP